MSTASPAQQSKVQLCSVVSASSGEDPIGSAWHNGHYIMLELPLPWKYDVFDSPRVPPGIRELVSDLYAQDIYPGFVGFAPDDAWSVAGMTRMIDFQLPPAPFAGFVRREYLIPTPELAPILRKMLLEHDATDLQAFAVPDIGDPRDIFVCTHGAIDACCAKFGYPLYKLLRHMADNPAHGMRVWRCTHFGGHRFAATMLDMPQGRYWGHLEARDLGPLVRREGDVEMIRRKYRGWAALPYGAAQVAEGELFRSAGWDWLECNVEAGETPLFDWENPVLGEQVVEFAYQHPERGLAGSVEVRVTPNGFIQTMGASNSDEWLDAQQFVTTIQRSLPNGEFFGRGEGE